MFHLRALPLLFCLNLLLCLATPAAAFSFANLPSQADSEFLPQEQAFRLQATRQQGQLLLQFDIAPGYYLYHDRVSLRSEDGRRPLWIMRQAGHMKQDANFGRVRVHEHLLQIEAGKGDHGVLVVGWQGCARGGLCYPPQTRRLDADTAQWLPAALPAAAPVPAQASAAAAAAPAVREEPRKPAPAVQDPIVRLLTGSGMVWLVGGFFLLGLGLSLTPCVFPMVPILAAIIAGAGPSLTPRRGVLLALAYVLGMATAYAAAGALTGYFGARANISLLLQHPAALIGFAGLFVLLSLSMFGLFELRLPPALTSRIYAASQRLRGGRQLSVFIMGAVSALVVSPCVSAPLAGVLLYISSTGDAALGALALFCLALGMGAPLLLLGAGGGSLLPRAGAWMVLVRQLFALLLLGMAVFLLGRLWPEPLTLGLWGLLLLAAALLLGVEMSQPRWRRLLSWPLALWGVFALIGAASGHGTLLAPLAAPAPAALSRAAAVPDAAWTTVTDPQQLQRQLAGSSAPVLVDVYADWCTACKDMEREVYSRADVRALMQGYTRLRLDMTANSPSQQAWLQQQRLFGPPALLLLDEEGRAERQRLIGEVPLAAVCRELAGSQAVAGDCGA